MKTVISGGTIYDGSGSPPVCKDILIQNGVIAGIGDFKELPDADYMDAHGKAVTPGFIDSHRHGDFAVFTDPDFGKGELAQGITTILNGNCGMSAAPAVEATRKQWYGFLEPCLGTAPKKERWNSFSQYLDSLQKRKLPLEMGALVGTGSIKTAVKGFSSSPWSRKEIFQAQNLLMEALDAGACGISCGIMYVPECYSTAEDYIEILRPAAAYGRPLSCHMRGEGDLLLQAVEEVIQIAVKTGLSLNISHFKVTGKKNWKKILPQAIDRIQKSRSQGQDITVDFYPYTGGSTTLLTLLPPDCQRENTEETLEWLSKKSGVEQLRKGLLRSYPEWDNMVQAIGWERIVISSVITEGNKTCQGHTIPEICEMYGDEDEAACVARLLCQEEGKAGIIVMSMDPEDVKMVAQLPFASVISDGLYGSPGFPHPRLHGAFPRIWREFVKKQEILTPEAAIYKMSGLPAWRYGLNDRGMIREGMRADINLFDPEEFGDTATFTSPGTLAKGMDTVLIAGQPVWQDGKWNKVCCAGVVRAR